MHGDSGSIVRHRGESCLARPRGNSRWPTQAQSARSGWEKQLDDSITRSRPSPRPQSCTAAATPAISSADDSGGRARSHDADDVVDAGPLLRHDSLESHFGDASVRHDADALFHTLLAFAAPEPNEPRRVARRTPVSGTIPTMRCLVVLLACLPWTVARA